MNPLKGGFTLANPQVQPVLSGVEVLMKSLFRIVVFLLLPAMAAPQQIQQKPTLPATCSELSDHVMGYVAYPALREVVLPPAWNGRGTYEAKLIIEKDGRVHKSPEILK